MTCWFSLLAIIQLMQGIGNRLYYNMRMSRDLHFSTDHDRKVSNQSKTAQNLKHVSFYVSQVILQDIILRLTTEKSRISLTTTSLFFKFTALKYCITTKNKLHSLLRIQMRVFNQGTQASFPLISTKTH
jgi:hypothetical protein